MVINGDCQCNNAIHNSSYVVESVRSGRIPLYHIRNLYHIYFGPGIDINYCTIIYSNGYTNAISILNGCARRD